MGKYDQIILDAFSKYNMKPRDNQLELVSRILKAYKEDKKEYVVLSASTGIGKSVIAVVVSECLAVLDGLSKPSSYILMHTNTLTKQYSDSFDKYYTDFVNIMGARNYNCDVLNDSAEQCIVKQIKPGKRHLCDRCAYIQSRKRMKNTPHVITNYSYFLVSAMYIPTFEPRNIVVYDEAHLINDVFSNHLEIKVSIDNLKFLIRKIQEIQTNKYVQYVTTLNKVMDAINGKMITERNYPTFLKKLMDLYKEIMGDYYNYAEEYLEHDNLDAFKEYSKVAKMFDNWFSKISEWFNSQYEHVIDIQDKSFILSPVFVGKMFDRINYGKYHLFMSATIDDEFICRTLKVDRSKVTYVKSPPVFKPESKSVKLINHDGYNFKKLKDFRVLDGMAKRVVEVLRDNSNHNGIILTPSFYLTEFLAKEIRKSGVVNLIEHKQGTKLAEALARHKKDTRKTVLISPSMFEGIDLPNDQSRFQIFIKAPYPSLGDKRIKYIFDKYPDIYEIMTLYKVIQGFGRSTRHNTDYSNTYALDRNISRLFHSHRNKWKDEFKII